VKGKQSFTISFRLDGDYLKRLDDEAAKVGLSVHERARQMLIELLDDKDRERLFEKIIDVKESITEVGGEVSRLRGDLAEAVEWMVKNLKAK
jgi:hypothetical protein